LPHGAGADHRKTRDRGFAAWLAVRPFENQIADQATHFLAGGAAYRHWD
jgi:hypothetical protein